MAEEIIKPITDQAAPPESGTSESPIGGPEIIEGGDTPEVKEGQVEAKEAKAPEQIPEAKAEDKNMFEPGGKSYEEVRKKMNDQGIELNKLRNDHSITEKEYKTALEELTAHKEWYNKYYPIMDEFYKDDALRPRFEKGAQPRNITEADAEKIADRKLQEFRDQTQFERTVDSWISSHPDMKGELGKRVYEFLEKNDLNPTPEILDAAYAHCNKAKLKEIGAREQELHRQKVSDAAVGGGGSTTPGKVGSPVDELFMPLASDYYPGR